MNTSPEFEAISSQGMWAELDQETKDFLKNYMQETSEKPPVIPKYFYHATPVSNLSSILENGLKVHEVFGEIYFCEKEKQTLKFIERPCVVFRLSTRDLNQDKIFFSADHKKTKERNFEAYTYYEDIEANKIKAWQVFR